MKNTKKWALIGLMCLQVTAVSVMRAEEEDEEIKALKFANIYLAMAQGYKKLIEILPEELPGAPAPSPTKTTVIDPKKLLAAADYLKYSDTVKSLIQKYLMNPEGPDAKEFKNDAPMHVALIAALIDSLPTSYLENFINVRVVDKDARKLLHAAAMLGYVNMIHLFFDKYGADANVQDFNGDTPLHLAIPKNNIDVIKALIKGGKKGPANLELQNMSGLTPLHVAAQSGSPETVALLIKAGAKKDALDEDGRDPRYYATKRGDAKVLAAFGK